MHRVQRKLLMHIDLASGLLEGVRFVPSPNFDSRPEGASVDALIIHAISLPPGEFGGCAIEQLFCNRLNPEEHPYYQQVHDQRVSAHVLIRRDGEVLQFVPFDKRAWHAGQSCCEGRTGVNDFSIGVELEGIDHLPFEPAQYGVLTDVTKAIMISYPSVSRDKIYGHCDIAPGRKTDPGPHFDWALYLQSL